MDSDNPFFEPLEDEGEGGAATASPNVFASLTEPQDLQTDDDSTPFAFDDDLGRKKKPPPEEEKEPRQPEKSERDLNLNGESDPEDAGEAVPPQNEEVSVNSWHEVFDHFPGAVVVLDEQQNIVYSNPAHASLMGVDAADCSDGMDGWFRKVCQDQDARSEVVASWHEHVWRNQMTRTFALHSPQNGVRHIEFRAALSPDRHLILLQEDVTDSQVSEEALRQAHLKFRNLFVHSAGGIVLVNDEDVILDVNRAFLEFAETNSQPFQGSHFAGLLHPDDAARLKNDESNPDYVASESSRKLRFLFEGQEKEKPALVTCAYIPGRDSASSLKLYQLKPRDNQLLNRLRELSRKAQALLDAIPNLFVLLDQKGTVVDWSPPADEWEEAPAFSAASVGKPASESWKEFGSFLEARLPGVFAGGNPIREDVPSDQGEDLSYKVTLAPFGREMALALIESTAADSKDEEASHPWLSGIFHHTREAVLIATPQGQITEVNPAAVAMLGQDRDVLLESSLFQLLSKSPGTDDEFSPQEVEALDSERQWTNLLSVSPSGPQPVAATLIPILESEEGPVRQFVALISPDTGAALSNDDVLDLAQRQFRSQLQTISSLFSINQSSHDSATLQSWLIRLKVLAESISSGKRTGVVHLLRDIADQVSSVAGRGIGPREVMITGSGLLSLDDELVTPFALLAGEIMCMGFCNPQKGGGPALFLEVESKDSNVILTVKPGANREVFTRELLDAAEVIDILVEQIHGKIEIAEKEEEASALILSFPAHYA